MTTKQFYRQFEQMTGNTSPGRLANIRHALSSAGIYPGHSRLTARGAAWLIFTAACAPTVKRDQLDEWVTGKRTFFAALRAKGETPAVDYLEQLFVNPELLDGIVAVMLEKTTGALMVTDGSSFNLVTQYTDAAEIPAAPVCTYLPAFVLQGVAAAVAETDVATLN